jgi:hypothetical protein
MQMDCSDEQSENADSQMSFSLEPGSTLKTETAEEAKQYCERISTDAGRRIA